MFNGCFSLSPFNRDPSLRRCSAAAGALALPLSPSGMTSQLELQRTKASFNRGYLEEIADISLELKVLSLELNSVPSTPETARTHPYFPQARALGRPVACCATLATGRWERVARPRALAHRKDDLGGERRIFFGPFGRSPG